MIFFASMAVAGIGDAGVEPRIRIPAGVDAPGYGGQPEKYARVRSITRRNSGSKK
jgi:hypothetical protein